DGSATRAHDGIVESFHNEERGLEQAFHFAAAPPGSGDLDVAISIEGAPFFQRSAGGLHFGEGAARGRYGHAVWVDSDGRRTEVPALWEGDAVHLLVADAVLRSSSYPSVLDPLISAEIELDLPISGNANGAQANPRVAFDGTNYLVVFHDPRIGIS